MFLCELKHRGKSEESTQVFVTLWHYIILWLGILIYPALSIFHFYQLLTGWWEGHCKSPPHPSLNNAAIRFPWVWPESTLPEAQCLVQMHPHWSSARWCCHPCWPESWGSHRRRQNIKKAQKNPQHNINTCLAINTELAVYVRLGMVFTRCWVYRNGAQCRHELHSVHWTYANSLFHLIT